MLWGGHLRSRHPQVWGAARGPAQLCCWLSEPAERQPHQRGPAASQPKDSSGRVHGGCPAAGVGLHGWLREQTAVSEQGRQALGPRTPGKAEALSGGVPQRRDVLAARCHPGAGARAADTLASLLGPAADPRGRRVQRWDGAPECQWPS